MSSKTEHNSLSKYIAQPSGNDVVFGRGGFSNHHPGNMKFRQIVESNKMKYKASNRLGKQLLASNVVQDIRNQGGKFLSKVAARGKAKGAWKEATYDKTISKTKQALREPKVNNTTAYADQLLPESDESVMESSFDFSLHDQLDGANNTNDFAIYLDDVNAAYANQLLPESDESVMDSSFDFNLHDQLDGFNNTNDYATSLDDVSALLDWSIDSIKSSVHYSDPGNAYDYTALRSEFDGGICDSQTWTIYL